MKLSASLLGALALSITNVAAFPAAMLEMMARAEDTKALEEVEAAVEKLKRGDFIMPRAPGFNAQQQYVSNQGQYAFVPPNLAGGDQRGPCPGLNAMANHGYLPHNGVATIDQFTTQTNKVFGMGLDLAAFLAVYGAVMDGDLTSWSIGGPAPGLLNGIGLKISGGDGISNSHNKYESDVSPTRGDLYEYGNDYKVQVSQFQDLFSRQSDPTTANYNLDILTDFRKDRFQQSISQNSEFFNGPFSGVLVQPAAYTFIYRFMANKSAEHPDGILNQDVLKSFFSITGNSGSFTWTEGYERIPDNWYKRAIGDEYTIPYFNMDLLAAAQKYPQFLDVGGNTGSVNSFAGVNIQNLTGGVYNLQSLAQGNNAMCFAYQSAQQAAPDVLKSLFSDVTSAVSKLNSAFTTVLNTLGCPQLKAIDTSQYAQYPGAKGAY